MRELEWWWCIHRSMVWYDVEEGRFGFPFSKSSSPFSFLALPMSFYFLLFHSFFVIVKMLDSFLHAIVRADVAG